MGRKRISVTLAAIGVSALIGFWMWTRTPQYAIRQIEQAIKMHDIQRFRKYVDVDGVAADTLSLVEQQTLSSGAVGSALATTMAGPLQDKVKRTLTNMVESQEAGPPRILYDVVGFGSTYSGVASVRRDGKVAIVGLEFTSKGQSEARVYEVRMRDLGSHWQVAGLNLPQIVAAKSIREAEERAQTERAARQEAASRTVKLLSVLLGEYSVIGGASSEVSATVTLSEPAFDDMLVSVASDSTAATVPSSITILKGESAATFIVEVSQVPTPVQATISAEAYGAKRTTTLTIKPRPFANDLTYGTTTTNQTHSESEAATETVPRSKPSARPVPRSVPRETEQLAPNREFVLAEAAAAEARTLELARTDASANGLVFVEQGSAGRVYHEPTCPSVTIAMKTLSRKAARDSFFLPAWDCHKPR